jgi:DnaD/phage-associated family protein
MFGLGSRNLTPREKKYFSAWLYEYKYSIEIIEMAYNIAVDTKGTPQINYINGILKITEGNGDQFGIFTTSYEDEALMTGICEKLAA